MRKTASLVLTTIYDPIILEEYYQNFQQYGHVDDVHVYVIPDRKTPSKAFERCVDLKRRGLKVVCPQTEDQEEFLRRVGFPPHLVPYNSDNRRNVGYLMALESATDFIISIDDDNFCRPEEDVFLAHAVVCERKYSGQVVNSAKGWFNICSLLRLDKPGTTYARGFPYYARHKDEQAEITAATVEVHINAGLWLKDPDVDGITWLVSPAHGTSFTGQSLILGKKVWSPINTQNTALRRDAIAAYYFVRMGYPLAGITIDRYGDIFGGYFVQACARHLNGAVRVGSPISEHRRNSHNYMKDAANEWACIMVLEDLLPWLVEAQLQGSSYPETYTSLSYALEEIVEKLQGSIWTDATRGYFHQIAYYMRKWARACSRLT